MLIGAELLGIDKQERPFNSPLHVGVFLVPFNELLDPSNFTEHPENP